MSDLDLALGPPPEIFIPPLSPVAGAPPPAPRVFAEPPPAPVQRPPAAPPAPVPPPAARPPAPPPAAKPPAPRPAPPPAQRPPAATPAPQTYTVQPGDTLGAIASKNGTTVDAIVHANPQISDPDNIYPGELIAYVGWLDSLGMSMIHFELYGDSARGELLTGGGGPFQRHPALRDPTPLIDRLYGKTFG